MRNVIFLSLLVVWTLFMEISSSSIKNTDEEESNNREGKHIRFAYNMPYMQPLTAKQAATVQGRQGFEDIFKDMMVDKGKREGKFIFYWIT